MLSVIFVLGFIADPIINMYLDPWSSLGWITGFGDVFEPAEALHIADEGPLNWAEHFLKGIAGLGVVGCLKVVLTSPLQFWRFRVSGGNGGRRSTGRDRINDISWLVILVGVTTTLWVGETLTVALLGTDNCTGYLQRCTCFQSSGLDGHSGACG